MNIKFSNPKKCDVVVYDLNNSEIIIDRVLDNTEVEFLYARGEMYKLGPRVFFFLLMNLWRISFDFIKYKKVSEYPRAIFGQLYRIYNFAYLRSVDPKYVITYIDDSYLFGWLVERYKRCPFFAIQNGTRDMKNTLRLLPPKPQAGSTFYLQHYFCFGDCERDLFNKNGHVVENYIPVGSLKGSVAFTQIEAEGVEKEFDICAISCWDNSVMIDNVNRPSFKVGMTRFHEYLAQASRDMGISVLVALRSDYQVEIDFYNKVYAGAKVSYQKFDGPAYSTYHAMCRAEMTMGNISTTLRERIGWGRKVLFCNFSEDSDYDCPREGIWFFNLLDKDKYQAHLKKLLEMPLEQYWEQTKDAARYMMQYDQSQTTDKLIKERIRQILES